MVNPAPAKPTRRDQQKSTDQLNASLVRWTRGVAVFTIFLVITSAVSDYFIYQQWVSANSAQSDTREQLRALVAFSGGIDVPANAGADGKPTAYAFSPRFHNYGSTRTFKFEVWVSIHYFEDGPPNSQDFSKPYQKVDVVTGGIIPPNGDAFTVPVAINAADAASVAQGKGIVVLWGHVVWADIFEKKDHIIDFCQSMIPKNVVNNSSYIFQPVPLRAECNSSS